MVVDHPARSFTLKDLAATPRQQLALVLVVAAVLFFVSLGSLPLVEPDEGRNAEVAREMLLTRDWITPHFDTLTYLDKPAMFFWLVAGSFRLCGVSEWAARLPSALAALGTTFLVWLLARRMFDERTGLRAGIVWAATPLVIAYARTVIFDMTLTFLVTAALVCFWFAEASGFSEPWLDVGMFSAMGLATFEKGPVGFIIPLLSIGAYEVARRRLRDLGRLRWGIGLAVFFLTAAPWYVVISIRHPDYLHYAVWQETLLRYATAKSRRAGSLFYYAPVFFAGFMPWSFFLLFAAWNRLRKWRALRDDVHRAALFLLASALAPFIFFSLGRSKLPGYVLPAMVPLSILMGRVWKDVGSEEEPRRRVDWLTAGFGTLLVLGILIAASPQLLRFPSVATLTARRVPPVVAAYLKGSLFTSGVILAAIGVFGRHLAVRRQGTALSLATFVLLAISMPLLLLRWLRPLRIYAETSSSRQLASTLLASPERNQPVYGFYYFRTSLPFYLQRSVGLVTESGGETTSNYISSEWSRLPSEPSSLGQPMGVTPSPGLPLFVDGAGLAELARSTQQPFLVMLRNTHVGLFSKSVRGVELLWTAWDYSVVEVPAAPQPGADQTPAIIDKVVH
ncbi:MAG TPA: glycosyltransferase family 39 protein [Terriglobia bacterium]|nr:glycosyltransferase family 39 protein [Terriglobia bacterium]